MNGKTKNKSVTGKRKRIFFLCAILPVLVINGLFLVLMQMNTKNNARSILRDAISRVEYEVKRNINDAVSVSDYLCIDGMLTGFLDTEYEDAIDYYDKFNRLMQDNVIRYYYTAQSVYRITIATDNKSILNGTYFMQISDVEDTPWYQTYASSEETVSVCAYYEDQIYSRYTGDARSVSILRKMPIPGRKALLKLDMNYTSICRNIIQENSNVDIYVCKDDQVIFTNTEDTYKTDFQTWDMKNLGNAITEEKAVDLFGETWTIYSTFTSNSVFNGMGTNLILFLAVLFFDIIFCMIAVYVDMRIRKEQQSLVVSKIQAELNALQSQMNPHFMYNTLESIRMHSVIKGEHETEEMLGKLSLLLRQASQWDKDLITMEEEMGFVKGYLEVQKYRFGDRVDYKVEMDEACSRCRIPKFVIVSLVENACVHGIEKSIAGGMIEVHASIVEATLQILIKDTGVGMDETQLEHIRHIVEQANTEDIYGSKHIGILNSAVRMKLCYKGNVQFAITSDKNQGTQIQIVCPVKYEVIDT